MSVTCLSIQLWMSSEPSHLVAKENLRMMVNLRKVKIAMQSHDSMLEAEE